jgi:hypothetical protein
MCEEVPGLRPAVLSENAKTMLEPYRRIRHVVKLSIRSNWNQEDWKNLRRRFALR